MAAAASEDTSLISADKHDHHHGMNSRHLYESVPIYAPPKQRQRWDDVQVLPHVNWGDLYFDLFYVAAAYQLSHAFMDSPTTNGLLYFTAAYLPMFGIWHEKLIFHSRYTFVDDNIYIRSLEIIHLVLLGVSVAYIQPFEAMYNTYEDVTMTIFLGAHLLDNLILCYLNMDVARNVIGGPEAKSGAYVVLWKKLSSMLFYVAAFIISCRDFYMTTPEVDPDQEMVGNYLPAYLTIIGFLWDFGFAPLSISFFIFPRTGKSHKEFSPPMNLEYVIHRIGEWVMLMLGESILSILTIHHAGDTFVSLSYGVSFVAGILTITMFQYLFFRSQPTEAKDHAMRRSQAGGYMYYYFHIFYSASLILVGCSYKLMLSSIHERQEIEEEVQEMNEDDSFEINQRIALLYAASQAVSFLSLDCMLMSHRGFKINFSRIIVTNPVTGKRRPALIQAAVMSVSLLLIGLTLCLSFMRDLTLLSVFGCLLVFCQVMLRTVGLKYFPITIAQMERALHPGIGINGIEADEGVHTWPNMTEPASLDTHDVAKKHVLA